MSIGRQLLIKGESEKVKLCPAGQASEDSNTMFCIIIIIIIVLTTLHAVSLHITRPRMCSLAIKTKQIVLM